ncbi:MAG: site-specific DNA-methyltransferase, partial [Chloroflexota bacterium]|nr:site-specific DNA-methyltransferase [Chloroflexota bacterium]
WTDPPYNVGKDYGDYDDDIPEDEYMEWVSSWIANIKRVSKSFAIYPPKIRLREFWNLMPDQHMLICAWSPMGAPRGGFIHQYIPLSVPNKPLIRTQDHWWNVQVPGMGYFYREKTYNHPGQTSLDITQRVILAFTRPGDLVLDPFGGTGTTAEACVNLGRRCLLVEQNLEYCHTAAGRINDAFARPKLIKPKDDGVTQLTIEGMRESV